VIDPEFLYAVAQVGATYAGFSTLVAVVAYRRDTGPIPSRIYYMLLLSIIVVAFSFVPAVVQNYGANESAAWKVSSALYGFVWSAYWINALITLKSRFRIGSDLSFLNKLHTYLLHPGAIIMLFSSAFGAWGKSAGAVYATALFIMLYMSAYLFLQIITGLLEHNASS
jgi:hypothetical protein